LKFIDHLQKEERSSLRMSRCITMILARKIIKRPFRDSDKEDIQRFIHRLLGGELL